MWNPVFLTYTYNYDLFYCTRGWSMKMTSHPILVTRVRAISEPCGEGTYPQGTRPCLRQPAKTGHRQAVKMPSLIQGGPGR